MARVLQSGWFAILIGSLVYLGTTGFLLLPGKGLKPPPRHEFVVTENTTGPSWDFFNPEVERLVKELAQEKKALALREQQLNELAARLEAERAEITTVTQAVHRLQQEFDRGVVRIREEETANLKRLAKVYATMSPEGAVTILKQMEDEQIVKFMVFMKDGETAPLLESFARQGEAEAKRAAAISERLRTAAYRFAPPKSPEPMIAAQPSPADPVLLGALPSAPAIDPPAPPASGKKQPSFDAAMNQAVSKDRPVSREKDAKDAAPQDPESKPAPGERPAAPAKAGKTSPAKLNRDPSRPFATEDDRKAGIKPDTTKAQAGPRSPGAAARPSLEVGSGESIVAEQPPAATASHSNTPIPSMALDVNFAQMPMLVPPPVVVRTDLEPSPPAPPADSSTAEARPVSSDAAATSLFTPRPDAPPSSPGANALPIAPNGTRCEDGISRSCAGAATAIPPAPGAALASPTLSLPTGRRSDQAPKDAKTLERALQPALSTLLQIESAPPAPGSEFAPPPPRPSAPTAWSYSTLPPGLAATPAAPSVSDLVPGPAPSPAAPSLSAPAPDPMPAPSAPADATFPSGPAHSSEAVSDSPFPPGPAPSPEKVIAAETMPATGIAGAKSSPEMKKAEETSRAPNATEQLLPGASALAARPADSRSPASNPRAISSVREFEKYQAPAPTTEYFPWTMTRPMDAPDGGQSLTLNATAASSPAPVMELMRHKISASALELKQVNADSMSVVLRPDAHTEVSLELRLHEGLVDVAAQFRKGDPAGLSAHWGELQQALSSQGIRLGALEASASPHFNGQSPADGFSRSNRQSSERENSGQNLEQEPFPLPARAPVREKLVARAPSAKRPWETWA